MESKKAKANFGGLRGLMPETSTSEIFMKIEGMAVDNITILEEKYLMVNGKEDINMVQDK